MASTTPYKTWGDFLKRKREVKYRSAREFCSKIELGISYPQYSRYESGDQLPSLKQAVTICRHLAVPIQEALLEWTRAQVDDEATLRDIDLLLDRVRTGVPVTQTPQGSVSSPTPGNQGLGSVAWSQTTISLDDVIVFNRSHLQVFQSDPRYRDVFTFVNAHAPEWVELEVVSHAVKMPVRQLEPMLLKLQELGVLVVETGKCKAAKRVYYFPDDEDFFPLRNLNYAHNSQRIIEQLSHKDLIEKKAYRGLLTRDFSPEQVEFLVNKLDALVTEAAQIPVTRVAQSIYSLCLLFGERMSQGKKAELPVAAESTASSGLTVRPAAGTPSGKVIA